MREAQFVNTQISVHRPCVRWIDSDTGEIKERHLRGRDPVIWSKHAPDNPTGEPQFRGEFEEWEMTGLEMALSWVPDLADAIERALMQGMSIELHVKVVGK